MPSNEEDAVVFKQPATLAERTEVAGKCCESLKITMPMVVDSIDDAVDERYAGWPERIFIVDASGRIAYAGGLGPWGFKPDDLERWLKANVP